MLIDSRDVFAIVLGLEVLNFDHGFKALNVCVEGAGLAFEGGIRLARGRDGNGTRLVRFLIACDLVAMPARQT
jgi:hypothetical protein